MYLSATTGRTCDGDFPAGRIAMGDGTYRSVGDDVAETDLAAMMDSSRELALARRSPTTAVG